MDEITVIPQHNNLEVLSAEADRIAAKYVFDDYNSRHSHNTRERHKHGMVMFHRYLEEIHYHVPGNLYTSPEPWTTIGYGLVDGFVRWMIAQGFAIATLNARLSTVKTYAKLAFKSKTLPIQNYAAIAAIEGYGKNQGMHLDEQRSVTRRSSKKNESIICTLEQILELKAHPNTPQGRRDKVMMCIFLDHGLRCGEMAILKVKDIDLKQKSIRFFRPKIKETQQMRLSAECVRALRAYLQHDVSEGTEFLLQSTVRSKEIDVEHITERGITKRVRYLGSKIGIPNLSAHDLRHTWATWQARTGCPASKLQHMGGWNSPAIPMRYISATEYTNEGVADSPQSPDIKSNRRK